MDSDSEQIFHDLEQRHVLLRKEHDVVCIEKEAFKGEQNIDSTEVMIFFGYIQAFQEIFYMFCIFNINLYCAHLISKVN